MDGVRVPVLLCFVAVFWGCAAEPGAPSSADKDAFRRIGPADGADPCLTHDFYGDGQCDRFCSEWDRQDCGFLNIGHRGAPMVEPENTLPAFDAALLLGANALEVDLCITADDHVVVWHDRSPSDSIALARQAGGEGLPFIPFNPNIGSDMRRPVDELTLAELRAEYGYAHRESLLDALLTEGERIDDAIIPTFDELARWAEDKGGLDALFLDIKLDEEQTDLAESLAAGIVASLPELAGGPVAYQLFFLSPHETIITQIEQWFAVHYPASGARFILDFEGEGALEATERLGYDAISTGKTLLRSFSGYIEELDITLRRSQLATPPIHPVVAWTLDDDADLMDLLQIRVDGMMTNRPGQLARLIDVGWDDHLELALRILECWESGETDDQTHLCMTMDQVPITAPVRLDGLIHFVCEQAHSSDLGTQARADVADDVFDCSSGITDAVNVRFDQEAAPREDLLMWFEQNSWPAADAVVIGTYADLQEAL